MPLLMIWVQQQRQLQAGRDGFLMQLFAQTTNLGAFVTITLNRPELQFFQQQANMYSLSAYTVPCHKSLFNPFLPPRKACQLMFSQHLFGQHLMRTYCVLEPKDSEANKTQSFKRAWASTQVLKYLVTSTMIGNVFKTMWGLPCG